MPDATKNQISSKAPKDNLHAALLAGLGLPSASHDALYWTSLNRTPPNCNERAPREIKEEEDFPPTDNAHVAYISGGQFLIPFFTFDMLRRAASVTDGNAFFGDYCPEEARSLSGKGFDLSLQYAREAEDAAKTLDGLNIVAEDLLLAAFLGKSAQRLHAAAHAPSEDESAAALARLALRLLCDCDDAGAARRRIEDFKARLDAITKGAGI